LILQANNGTQIISFQNFNVVKTDINGNATIVGDLTGNNALFYGGVRVNSLTATTFVTRDNTTNAAVPGVILSNNYYDSFTINNGLITSATLTSQDYAKNPLYININSQLSAISATQTQILTSSIFTTCTASSAYCYSQSTSLLNTTSAALNQAILNINNNSLIYDSITSINVAGGATVYNIVWPNFFALLPTSNISLINITPSSFIISPSANNTSLAYPLTALPYVYNIQQGGISQTDLLVSLYTGAPKSNTAFYVRTLITY